MNKFKNDIDNQTPRWCCKYMVSLIGAKPQKVLEPTPGYGNLAKELKEAGHTVIYPEDDFLNMRLEWYDIVVMNPPFRPIELCLRIFEKCMSHTDKIVTLINWDFFLNSGPRSKLIFDYGIVKVVALPRSAFPSSWPTTCILVLEHGYQGDSVFEYFDYRDELKKAQIKLKAI